MFEVLAIEEVLSDHRELQVIRRAIRDSGVCDDVARNMGKREPIDVADSEVKLPFGTEVEP